MLIMLRYNGVRVLWIISPESCGAQDGASGQCVCICQPAQNQNQNQRNTNDNAAQQDGSSSNSATSQDSTQNSAAVQSTPSRSGSSGLINPDVGGGGGSGGSLTGFGTLGESAKVSELLFACDLSLFSDSLSL